MTTYPNLRKPEFIDRLEKHLAERFAFGIIEEHAFNYTGISIQQNKEKEITID